MSRELQCPDGVELYASRTEKQDFPPWFETAEFLAVLGEGRPERRATTEAL
jgi:hypothetical protein